MGSGQDLFEIKMFIQINFWIRIGLYFDLIQSLLEYHECILTTACGSRRNQTCNIIKEQVTMEVIKFHTRP